MKRPTWTTACPGWERRIVTGKSLIPCAPLFPGEAAESMRYFDALCMVDVAGSPTFGEACRPWMRDFAAAVFGAYDPGEDARGRATNSPTAGRRLISEFFLCISKKNGKSTLAAGIMMTALLRNWRKSGEFLILAPTIEVAANSFKPCRDMVAADEELSSLLLVQEHIRTITHRITGATLSVVAADSATVSGKKAIGVFVDELHEFGKKPRASQMLVEATGGKMSRPEGFTIFVTTHADDPPAGVFREKLMFARAVRDGSVAAPHFMPVIFEFPESMRKSGADRDLSNAYITNPNLGASVDEATLREKWQEAQHSGEESMRGFLAKHLNIEVGLSLRSDRWAGADFWEAAGRPEVTFDYLIKHSEVIVAGIDGGGLDDLLGLALVGRHRDTGKWMAWAHAWAHKIVLERRKEVAPALRDFANAGDLTIVENPGDDVMAVADIICQVKHAGLLPEKLAIGVDAAGINDVVDELTTEDRGITMDQIVAISQGWKLNSSIKTTERKVAGGDLIHGGRPMMAWCVGNAKIEPRGNAILVTKQASGTAKIDPLMALFNAVSLMGLNPKASEAGTLDGWLTAA